MKNLTNINTIARSSLALALVMVICSPLQAQSAESTETKKATDVKMMERCQGMNEQKQKMMDDMKAQDALLTEQLTKMNSAPDDKKVSLMAAVITLMAEQRIAMNAQMAKMETEKMQHMQMMGKESMSQSPMMKGMDEKSGNAKKEQK